MGKVKPGVECIGDMLVTGKLLTVIGGQCDDPVGPWRQKIDEGIRDALGCVTFDLFDQGETGFSLGQGDQGLSVVFTDQDIEFPVTDT